ncbi:MAG: site-specific integrase, partial [Caldilineaceae bacterium]|nr:site-specific integrase [Caldilineaceae bacterium]
MAKTTITTAYDLSVLDCKSRRLTPKTMIYYENKLGVFFKWAAKQGVHHLEDITAHLLRQFLTSIAERGLTDTYQHDIGRAIRAWLNYCVRDELIAKSPFDKVRLPRLSQRALPAFTPADMQAILAACHSRRDEA